MPRYKLTLEYDGSAFVGWQRQTNGLSVQQAIEEAAQRYCGVLPVAHAAGRTDSGVHALGQIAHIDLGRADPAEKVRDAINAHLRPLPVAVRQAERVDDDFHARFSALERSYVYRILCRRAHPVLEHGKVWWVARPLNAEAMHEAGQVLVGNHDFTSFRATECQSRSPVKTLDLLTVTHTPVPEGSLIEIFVRARSFLHHQVRNMVGTLSLVGTGKWTDRDVRKALEARSRSSAGPTAPACGLYFFEVRYPSVEAPSSCIQA
ncbi:tRNA pseudouridine(38-40) synthase TruA [Haematospirillum sp. 15-248]|uniref:tRNA pseudouridine(38-40) synthase TruA n=1 Tax=Haematospirillum sp. 15-248 TaxID=2723107 RepID=UPI00143AC936|nr:tRNA pseudouridine(38-40) synthase TruA [Haematospirillum sp. 15-248]NKD88543.1 tRNA pseudouridine(38-40) synthase TruA [Haematospirillum sp. 15-248]